MRRSLPLLLALVTGCTPNIADGHFGCSVDSDCPSGLTCHDSLCYRGSGPTDGAVSPDAFSFVDANVPDTGVPHDASTDAFTGQPDANVDAGPCTTCIDVTVTNALSTMVGGATVMLETTAITFPSYGQTNDSITVDIGADGKLEVSTSALPSLTQQLSATPGMSYALVVGGDIAHLEVVLLPPPPAAVPGKTVLSMVNLAAGGSDTFGVLADTQTLTLSEADTAAGSIVDTTSADLAIQISTPSVGLVAAYEWSPLPGGSYYGIIAGSRLAALADSNGLVLIPVIPGANLHSSGSIYRAFNGGNDTVTICDGAMPLATLTSGELDVMRVGFTGTADVPSVHAGADCSSSSMYTAPIPDLAGRVLVSILGNVIDAAWSVTPMAEPPPAAAGITQTIIIQNGNSGTTSQYGPDTTAPFDDFTSALNYDGVGSTRRTSPPANIVELVAVFGPDSFPWGPTGAEAFALFDSDLSMVPASPRVWEIDAPFGDVWQVNPVPPR